MKNKFNVAVFGLGGRGVSMCKTMMEISDVLITAVCDPMGTRAEDGAVIIEQKQGVKPSVFTNSDDIFNLKDIDAVMVFSAWESHVDLTVAAMEKGIPVACEVGGAYSVDDCFRLVKTYERTGTPCMLLENCCYGRNELMAFNMAQKGVFGELIHCRGGYHHDLRKEVTEGGETGHYRLRNYMYRNCENYPTHELGPIAKLLGINDKNRMISLTSVASKAAGLNCYAEQHRGSDDALSSFNFAQGDVVTTTITCADGQTIVITLDTTLPRAYSRGFEVRGTKAAFFEDTESIFIDGVHNEYDFKWKEQWGNIEGYRKEYEHDIWQNYVPVGGHDGMDWLVLDAFFESLRTETDTPIDVYDMAAWMSISTLSEQSIALGGAPVLIPDFTNGKYLIRKKDKGGKYDLQK